MGGFDDLAERECRRFAARDGAHFAFGVYAFRKSTPSRATRSKEGVSTQVDPYAPKSRYEASSAMAKRMFGLSAGAEGAVAG